MLRDNPRQQHPFPTRRSSDLMGKWASRSSSTTADTAAREDRRGHGQHSPDPLPPGDPKQTSQPFECLAGASETLPPEDPPSADGSPRGRGTEDRAALHLGALV